MKCNWCGFTCTDDLVDEFFYKDSSTKSGHRAHCSECARKVAKLQRQNPIAKEKRKISNAKFKKSGKGQEGKRRYHMTDAWKRMALSHLRKHQAAKRGVTSTLTAREWEQIKEAFGWRCAYCGIFIGDEATQDHVIPLSKGGHHTKENVVPACRSCNSHKRAETWTITLDYT